MVQRCYVLRASRARRTEQNLFGGTVWHLEGQVYECSKSRINLLKFKHKYLHSLGKEKRLIFVDGHPAATPRAVRGLRGERQAAKLHQ
jgi:hypothetical protein